MVDQRPAHDAMAEVRVLPQLLGRRLQLREVVVALLNEVGDLLRGRQGGLDAAAGAVRDALGEGLGVVEGAPVGAVEIDDRAAHLRGAPGDLADRALLHLVFAQERVAEYLDQFAREPGLLVLGEAVQVDVEVLRQLEEDGDGHRPLVVLDQVEIARRDAEAFRHLRLGQPALPAQPANLVSEQGVLVHGALPFRGLLM